LPLLTACVKQKAQGRLSAGVGRLANVNAVLFTCLMSKHFVKKNWGQTAKRGYF